MIIKNRELEILSRTEKTYLPLKYLFIDQVEKNPNNIQQTEAVNKITEILDENITEDYIIFTEKGVILHQSSNDQPLEEKNKQDATSSIANKEFMNQPFLMKTYNNSESNTYIPIMINSMDDFVILIKFKIENPETHLNKLYRVVLTIIVIVLVFQFLFGLIFYYLIIKPVKSINNKSLAIKSGALSTRVNIKRKDEIGQLGKSFNEMAASIEENIKKLKQKNKTMLIELNAAGRVQAGIYPKIQNSDNYNVAVYHKPAGTVSGDYYDIFRLSEKNQGFLVVDVSGHGVPAALTTLRIQNTFKRLVAKFEDTGQLMEGINNELFDLMENFSCYFTAFYLSLGPEKKIMYTNAGHLPAYLIKTKSRKIYELTSNGFVIGLPKNIKKRFQMKTAILERGDKIIMLTDGITEAVNDKNDRYTTIRLLQVILKYADKSCELLKKSIISQLNKFVGKAKRKDDETLMIIEIK